MVNGECLHVVGIVAVEESWGRGVETREPHDLDAHKSEAWVWGTLD